MTNRRLPIEKLFFCRVKTNIVLTDAIGGVKTDFFLNYVVGDVMADFRCREEDLQLCEVYIRAYESRTLIFTQEHHQQAMISRDIKLKKKIANVAGLQLSAIWLISQDRLHCWRTVLFRTWKKNSASGFAWFRKRNSMLMVRQEK